MDYKDLAGKTAAPEHMRENTDMKTLAKEILPEENYERFIKSCRFTFWFQLLGTIAGFVIPSAILVAIYRDVMMVTFGAAIGIFWMILWMIISVFMPQARIYREFAKWYRRSDVSVRDLDRIFYR